MLLTSFGESTDSWAKAGTLTVFRRKEGGEGPSVTNAIDFGVRYRPSDPSKELAPYPAALQEWEASFADKPDKPLYNLYHTTAYILSPETYEPNRNYFVSRLWENITVTKILT